jgi:hypothetical protein
MRVVSTEMEPKEAAIEPTQKAAQMSSHKIIDQNADGGA